MPDEITVRMVLDGISGHDCRAASFLTVSPNDRTGRRLTKPLVNGRWHSIKSFT